MTRFSAACRKDDLAMAKALFKEHPWLLTTSCCREALLSQACFLSWASNSVLDYLLSECSMDVNHRFPYYGPLWHSSTSRVDSRPLHKALAIFGNASRVSFLLKRGANPKLTNEIGQTALQRAQQPRVPGVLWTLQVRTEEAEKILESREPQLPNHLQLVCRAKIRESISQRLGQEILEDDSKKIDDVIVNELRLPKKVMKFLCNNPDIATHQPVQKGACTVL